MTIHRYFVYILKCCDSYYIGITNDLDRRLKEHRQEENPFAYIYARRPVTLVYYEEYEYVQDAIDREKQLKKWSRKKKEALIEGDYKKLQKLARAYN